MKQLSRLVFVFVLVNLARLSNFVTHIGALKTFASGTPKGTLFGKGAHLAGAVIFNVKVWIFLGLFSVGHVSSASPVSPSLAQKNEAKQEIDFEGLNRMHDICRSLGFRGQIGYSEERFIRCEAIELYLTLELLGRGGEAALLWNVAQPVEFKLGDIR